MKVNIGNYRKNRKVNIEIHEYDLWSMYHTISLILVPLFKKYKEKAPHTIPSIFLEEANNSIELSEKIWSEALDKIIWSFEEIANFNQNEPDFKGNFEFSPQFKMAGATEEEYINWKLEVKLYEEKIQEGLDLFAKYFRSFWY